MKLCKPSHLEIFFYAELGEVLVSAEVMLDSLTLIEGNTGVDDEDLEDILNTQPKLTILNLESCAQLSEESSKCIAQYCPQLKHLVLCTCQSGSEFLVECKELQNLNISTDITPQNLTLITQSLPELNCIVMHNDEPQSSQLVAIVAKNCPKLTHLDLNETPHTTANIADIAKHCKQLKTLILRDYQEEEETEGAGEAALMLLPANLASLTELNVRFSGWVSDAFVTALAQNCIGLAKLDIYGCDITDVAILALAKHAHNLTSLAIRSPTIEISEAIFHEHSVVQLIQSCPLLVSLDARHTTCADSTIIAFSAGCQQLQFSESEHCFAPIIRKVVGKSGDVDRFICNTRNLKSFKISCLALVALHCPQLHSLSLCVYKDLTNRVMKTVFSRCPLLENFSLNDLGGETLAGDQLIADLTDFCPLLHTLSLNHLTLHDDSMIRLVEARTGLKELWLIGSEISVSDAFVTRLSECCVQLKHLTITHNTVITQDSVSSVVKSCTQLKHLSVNNCTALGDCQSLLDTIADCGDSLRVLLMRNCNVEVDRVAAFLLKCRTLDEFKY